MNCEQRYSECSNHPCLNNGTCVDYDGITCQCLDGYSGATPVIANASKKISVPLSSRFYLQESIARSTPRSATRRCAKIPANALRGPVSHFIVVVAKVGVHKICIKDILLLPVFFSCHDTSLFSCAKRMVRYPLRRGHRRMLGVTMQKRRSLYQYPIVLYLRLFIR